MTLVEMFNRYADERGMGAKVIHYPTVGFVTYHLHDDGECYIEDIYVLPEKRRSHMGTILANEVVKIAKLNGCHMLTGSVVPNAMGAEISRKALIGYGFSLFEESPEFEKYSKEI